MGKSSIPSGSYTLCCMIIHRAFLVCGALLLLILSGKNRCSCTSKIFTQKNSLFTAFSVRLPSFKCYHVKLHSKISCAFSSRHFRSQCKMLCLLNCYPLYLVSSQWSDLPKSLQCSPARTKSGSTLNVADFMAP